MLTLRGYYYIISQCGVMKKYHHQSPGDDILHDTLAQKSVLLKV